MQESHPSAWLGNGRENSVVRVSFLPLLGRCGISTAPAYRITIVLTLKKEESQGIFLHFSTPVLYFFKTQIPFSPFSFHKQSQDSALLKI